MKDGERLVNKRLELLEKMTAAGQADAFTWYGLAMEYRREGRLSEARSTFETLEGRFPEYVPAYLMAGQLLIELGETERASEVLEAGITQARERGDGKALGELQELLETI
jgi:predicted Zn-dependent protease